MGWQEFQVVALPGMQVMEFDELPRKSRNKLLRVSKEVWEEEERIVRMKRAWVAKQLKAMEEAFYGTPHFGVWESALKDAFRTQFVALSLGPKLWGVEI